MPLIASGCTAGGGLAPPPTVRRAPTNITRRNQRRSPISLPTHRHGGRVAPAAGEHTVRNRAAVHHHNAADQHLTGARLAVATMTVRTGCRGTLAFKVRRGQIVEDYINLHSEQIMQPQE